MDHGKRRGEGFCRNLGEVHKFSLQDILYWNSWVW